MNPLTFRLRYIVAILFAAVLTAAVLRHVIHIYGGLSREDIRFDALLGVALIVLVAMLFRRKPRR
jgi:hypothetical protein